MKGVDPEPGLPMKNYEFFDHTADLGVIFYGRDPLDLFKNAALGLFDIMLEVEGDSEKVEAYKITVEGDDWEDLFVNWLGELIYLFYGRGLVLRKLWIDRIDKKIIEGIIYCEKFNPEYHRVKKEIKAATYHQLEVRREEDKWIGKVVFDI